MNHGLPDWKSRRDFLQHCGLGLGSVALAQLLGAEGVLAESANTVPRALNLHSRTGHFPSKAKAVIQLVQEGGPSQMDLFDPKPELSKRNGEKLPTKSVESFQKGSESQQLLGSPFQFRPRGESGMVLSELLVHTGELADDLCLVRSMYSENNNHPEAQQLFQTGKITPGRPTLGSWVSYGLGTESQDLPAYLVLLDPDGPPGNGSRLWDNGWLPALYRGTEFNSRGAAVHNLKPFVVSPAGVQHKSLELLAWLNQRHRRNYPQESELETRIRNYELAARMQMSATDALDLSQETAQTQALYGIGSQPTDSYGRRCLIARRLVERGVRFVQLFINAQIWDNHTGLATDMKAACDRTDLPIAGLLHDLKQRGLLDETLIVWGGEFGRLPIAQLPKDKDERKAGRDHNKNAACCWFAGGGVRGGTTYGATDELGFAAVENRVSVPDYHATILHLLGLNHEELFVNEHGLKEKLTGVQPARVVREIML